MFIAKRVIIAKNTKLPKGPSTVDRIHKLYYSYRIQHYRTTINELLSNDMPSVDESYKHSFEQNKSDSG